MATDTGISGRPERDRVGARACYHAVPIAGYAPIEAPARGAISRGAHIVNIFEILLYLFACLSAIYVTHLGFYLIGANLYDIKRLRHPDPNTTDGPGPGQSVNLGLVTIGISARNEAKVIRRCLDSIRQSTYRPIQILVADDGSTDGTRQLVRDYRARHPELDLQVFRQPVSIGKGKELNRLYRRYAKGKFCMTLDADSILHPDAITNAVRYFADPTVVAVAANVRIIEEPTILGVLQKLEHLIGYRSKKLYSVLNCECIVGGVASTYRASLLREVGYYDIDTVTEDIGLSMKAMRLGNRTRLRASPPSKPWSANDSAGNTGFSRVWSGTGT